MSSIKIRDKEKVYAHEKEVNIGKNVKKSIKKWRIFKEWESIKIIKIDITVKQSIQKVKNSKIIIKNKIKLQKIFRKQN